VYAFLSRVGAARVALVGIFFLYLITARAGASGPVWDVGVYDGLIIAAGAITLMAARPPVTGWRLLGAGIVVWGVCDGVVTASGQKGVVSAAASAGFVLACGLALGAVWVLVAYSAGGVSWFVVVDAALLSLLLVSVWLVAAPQAGPRGRGGAAMVMWIANPVSDVLLVAAVCGAFAALGFRRLGSWWALIGGFGVVLAADVWWMSAHMSTSVSSQVPALGWLSGFMIISVTPVWFPPPLPASSLPRSSTVASCTGAAFLLVLMVCGLTGGSVWVVLCAVGAAGAAGRVWLTSSAAARVRGFRTGQQRDPVTGLLSRTVFLHHVSAAERTGVVAVGVVDIVGFRGLNSAYGHGGGDTILREVSARLVGALESGAVVGRLGGGEFGVVLAGAGAGDAGRLVRRLAAVCSRDVVVDGGQVVSVLARAGAAATDLGGVTAGSVVSCAQVAATRAKQFGLPSAVFNASVDADASSRVVLMQQFREGVAHGQLLCVYQPKVDFASGAVVGVEALVRWNHPDRGVISPGEFVPVVESFGAMDVLAAAVLEVVCLDIVQLRAAGIPVPVAVNVSVTNLCSPGFALVVADVLSRFGLSAHDVVVEVTESVLVDPARRDVVADAVEQLHALGVQIAVDDFGTAAASVAQARDLAAQELKLDRSFVTGLTHDSLCRTVVASTVVLASQLGVRLVAEGVESPADVRSLAALGVPVGQGFLFGRPFTRDQLVTFWGTVVVPGRLPDVCAGTATLTSVMAPEGTVAVAS